MTARGFPEEEYRARTLRAQAMMAEQGLAGLLLTTEPEIRYLTGFLTRFWESPTRPWHLVVPAAGDPVAVIPGIGAELMGRTWVPDIRTWSAPAPGDDGVSLLIDTLRELAPGTVGVPMGHETRLGLPLADFRRLEAAGIAFADATALVQRLHRVKSEAEIEKIREICAIGGRAFARVPEIARAGVPLADVFRRFQGALLAEGADWVPYVAGAAAPGGYGDVISPADERPLAAGDVLMLDTGALRDGYFCDYDRNWAIGQAGPDTVAAHARLWEATEAGIAAARPGATAADVHRAMADLLPGEGNVGRMGHGLGMRLTEWPSLMPGDGTVLEPGMVITLEPGFAFAPGRMLVHEEDIVIRERGAELLTPRAPRDLPVIG